MDDPGPDDARDSAIRAHVARLASWAKKVDPDGRLTEDERQRRAELAYEAYLTRRANKGTGGRKKTK